ncbi:hypothetical protein MPSEU_000529600 [Mayamaea pseudoterrestris]|nr:hypothetical protein MPSEU_000529600 [Mayamaea pseudoterrestris]
MASLPFKRRSPKRQHFTTIKNNILTKRKKNELIAGDNDGVADAFGDALQVSLNSSSAFSYKASNNEMHAKLKEDGWTTPLFTVRNLRRLLKWLIFQSLPLSKQQQRSSVERRGTVEQTSPHQQQHYRQLWNVVKFFGLLLLLLMSLAAATSAWLTVQVTWTVYLAASLTIRLLLDTRTEPLASAQRFATTFMSVLDLYLFQAHRYVGRDLQIESLAAPTNISSPARFSKATLLHRNAIAFCLDMMTQQQTDARRKFERNSKAATGKSSCFGSSQSTLQNHVAKIETSCTPPRALSLGTIDPPSADEDGGYYGLAMVPSMTTLIATPVQSPTHSRQGSGELGADMPWLDVGAKIGLRLLNSAHVQRVMSATTPDLTRRQLRTPADTDDDDQDYEKDGKDTGGSILAGARDQRIHDAKRRPVSEPRVTRGDRVELHKPIHTLWTSPSAAMSPVMSNRSEDEKAFFPDSAQITTTLNSGYCLKTTTMQHATGHEDDRLSSGRPPLSPRSIDKEPDLQERDPSVTMQLESNSTVGGEDDIHREMDERIDLSPPQINRFVSLDDEKRPIRFQSLTNPSPDFTLPTQKPTQQTSCRREPLQAGVKVAVPIFPLQPRQHGVVRRYTFSQYQMGTVVRSKRIYVASADIDTSRYYRHNRETNCLSVTVKLDKSFLRNAEFAELSFRVLDSWSTRYMPKCSKVPIGACVATKYGIGVLVGWRVEGDCHVIRSLWNRRGAGSAHAYLGRDAIYSTIEAAIGFDVKTRFGGGVVVAYVDGGKTFDMGRYLVAIYEDGRHCGHVLDVHRNDIYACYGSQFIPIIEHVREAALYQIQVDNYNAALREQLYSNAAETSDPRFWNAIRECGDILWDSFLRAVEEDKDFDAGVNEFMAKIIEFLERLDSSPADCDVTTKDEFVMTDFEIECITQFSSTSEDDIDSDGCVRNEPGMWLVNDIFGGFFKQGEQSLDETSANAPKDSAVPQQSHVYTTADTTNFDRAFAVIRTLMHTVTFAKAASVDHPHFRLAMTVVHEVLLFVRNCLKVIYKNRSSRSTEIWKEALQDLAATFGPLKARLHRIGLGIAQRMEKQGRKAKARALQLVDTIISDEKLLFGMEQGDWAMCVNRLEIAFVQSNVVEKESMFYYRKAAQYICKHIQSTFTANEGAATRNNEKMALLGHIVRSLAAPRRTILKTLLDNDILEVLERILVRVYCREELSSRMLTIHASNFHSLRHLRIFKDISVAGRMWRPLLDAADEEFSWVVSNMPENSQDFMCPLSSLFSLCVARFHKMSDGDLSKDWLDFLLEPDAVRIIQDIDMKLLLALRAFSEDIKEMMVILPYYSNIDDDILKLMDEVNVDEFVKGASKALDDPDALAGFLKQKTSIAVERFLNYLPRLSIPVEKRELGEGFVLTCRGHDGSDLTLSDVVIRRENLVCRILGGDSLFFPMIGDESSATCSSNPSQVNQGVGLDEEDVLAHIRKLLAQAQSYGCWTSGVNGIGEAPSDPYVASALHGLPVSNVLNCAFELWRNLEIDDDELLEVAIKDVSLQIQLQKKREENMLDSAEEAVIDEPTSHPESIANNLKVPCSVNGSSRRFNPRADPTIFFLEMSKLTLNLDNFLFRIEKGQPQSVFDPVLEGRAMISLQNISMRLRVDCAKQRLQKPGQGFAVAIPILQITELDVQLEDMKMRVKDTGFGSDWLLNRAVKTFAGNITNIVKENLRAQIREQCQSVVDSLNAYFAVNPNMLLSILGISIDDLDDTVVWV